MMKKDLYQKAISLEQEALRSNHAGSIVKLKTDKTMDRLKSGIILTGIAAAIVFGLLTIRPQPELHELKRAEKMMTKLHFPVVRENFSDDIAIRSIEGFKQQLSTRKDQHTLIRKFNSIIDKHEQKLNK